MSDDIRLIEVDFEQKTSWKIRKNPKGTSKEEIAKLIHLDPSKFSVQERGVLTLISQNRNEMEYRDWLLQRFVEHTGLTFKERVIKESKTKWTFRHPGEYNKDLVEFNSVMADVNTTIFVGSDINTEIVVSFPNTLVRSDIQNRQNRTIVFRGLT